MSLPQPRVLALDEGSTVTVLPARPRDARGWIELLTRVSREDRLILLESVTTTRREMARVFRFTAWSFETAAIVAVAGPGQQVVGQLTATRNRNIYQHTAELGLSVAADFRSRGIGRELLEGAKDWARIFGVEKLCLNVVPDNQRAIRFYEKAGFEHEGHRVRHAKLSYGYEDLLEMSLWV